MVDQQVLAVIAVVVVLAVVFFLMQGPSTAFKKQKRPTVLTLPIVEKTNISHDTICVRLGLPSQSQVLGLPCGMHMSVSDESMKIIRPYTPTSDGMRTKGSVELVIKVYKPCDRFPKGGQLSQYINGLTVGDKLRVRGPLGKIKYMGRGRIEDGKKTFETKAIGMVAGGTGITPMLQLINEIIQDPSDKTEVSLLYANKSEDDILVRERLEKAAAEAKRQGKVFNLWYTLDKAPKDWKYSEGFVDQKMIKNNMPKPGDNPIMLFCGPPPMLKYAVQPNLEKLKYPMERFLQF